MNVKAIKYGRIKRQAPEKEAKLSQVAKDPNKNMNPQILSAMEAFKLRHR